MRYAVGDVMLGHVLVSIAKGAGWHVKCVSCGAEKTRAPCDLYACRECKKRSNKESAPHITCVVCGAVRRVQARTNRTCCSHGCKKTLTLARWAAQPDHCCKVCGAAFIGRGGRKITCSPACTKKNMSIIGSTRSAIDVCGVAMTVSEFAGVAGISYVNAIKRAQLFRSGKITSSKLFQAVRRRP